MRLRLPLPLDQADGNTRIAYTVVEGAAAELKPAPGRLDIRLPVPRGGHACFEADIAFLAQPVLPSPALELGEDERALYLNPGEGFIRVTPRIREMADLLGGDEKEPRAIVRRFWDFLLDRLNVGIVHYDSLDPRRPLDDVLDRGWLDCQLASALLAALCRSRGIPARIAGGYLLYPASPFRHYWAEAWIDRCWVPMDPIASDLWAGSAERAWRDCFFGKLDYRLTTQCLPRYFDSSPSIRFPARWQVLSSAEGDGVETSYIENDNGALIYRDRLSVVREPAPRPADRA